MFIPGYGNIYRFNFYVYDAETKKPIEGAEIRIYSNAPGGYVTGLTDDRGYCWLGSDVGYGFKKLEVLKAGYETYSSSTMPKEVDYGENYIYLQKIGQPSVPPPEETNTCEYCGYTPTQQWQCTCHGWWYETRESCMAHISPPQSFLERAEQFVRLHKLELLGASTIFIGFIWLVVGYAFRR